MDHRRKGEPEQPNHVILMTIINPAYPITVLFRFENVESATRAREALHGADIYAGCCTLRVEYAKPAKLNVYRNDSESWDYTNSGVSKLMVHRWVKHIHGIK
ncbi:RNA recognition motif domain [Trinorchestia longiramus]|nr:RNA recognition motif domain [Trinorchestia longiramus]